MAFRGMGWKDYAVLAMWIGVLVAVVVERTVDSLTYVALAVGGLAILRLFNESG